MFPENNACNVIHPRLQQRQLQIPPDVMIYDTARAPAYPNGRALVDNVVALVGDQRVLANELRKAGSARPLQAGAANHAGLRIRSRTSRRVARCPGALERGSANL